MFKWLRKTKPEPKPTHMVQLHRAVAVDGATIRVLNSWAPIPCMSEAEAEQTRTRLYRDNRWGDATSFPHVCITKIEEQS